MTLTRRQLLQLAGGAAVAVPFAAACGGSGSTGQLLRSGARLPEPFQVPLPVPPVLEPTRRDGDTDYYEITQRTGEARILPGPATEVWGYDGVFPGPTIESRSGRRTVVRHRNELPVPIATHLHGGVTPPVSDGYPTDLVMPVGGWDATETLHDGQRVQDAKEYAYPLPQRAATLWYHDHRMDFTAPQVWRGLAGFHLVHDDEEEALPLPKGERDIPLMICDRAFAEDGSFRYPAKDPDLVDPPGVEQRFMEGVMGDTVLVNGAAWPYLEVTNTRYRFRVLNASNARRYQLALDPPPPEGPSFVQVGSDVGLLGRPVEHDQLEIAQAERFDVVVDFSKYPMGTQVTLTNAYGEDATGEVMRFHVARKANDDSTVPPRLAEFEPLPRSAATVTRDFRFTRGGDRDGQVIWMINDRPFDPERIDARPELGATEIWRLTTDVHHPVHIHLAHFQVLGRAGRGNEPGPYDAGWKDTIDLPGGEVAEVIARFDGFRGKYVFHCHNLEHEDMMMMANLEVV